MKFFTEMSGTTFWSLTVISGSSLIYKNFWCRYLCPYGALLGLLSLFQSGKNKTERGEMYTLRRLYQELSFASSC